MLGYFASLNFLGHTAVNKFSGLLKTFLAGITKHIQKIRMKEEGAVELWLIKSAQLCRCITKMSWTSTWEILRLLVPHVKSAATSAVSYFNQGCGFSGDGTSWYCSVINHFANLLRASIWKYRHAGLWGHAWIQKAEKGKQGDNNGFQARKLWKWNFLAYQIWPMLHGSMPSLAYKHQKISF